VFAQNNSDGNQPQGAQPQNPVDDAQEPLTVIGPFTICGNGLIGFCDTPRRPVRRDHVEISKTFMKLCRRTAMVGREHAPVSSLLKHVIERWAHRYISTGAVIVAALEMEIAVTPVGEGSRDAMIGINIRDVKRLTKEVWSWT